MLDLANSGDDPSAGKPSMHRLRAFGLRGAAILALITISVAFILLCACDFPLQHPASIAFLLLSLVACLTAAYVLFRVQAFLPDSQPILRAVASTAIAIGLRYVELMLAIKAIAWLAERAH